MAFSSLHQFCKKDKKGLEGLISFQAFSIQMLFSNIKTIINRAHHIIHIIRHRVRRDRRTTRRGHHRARHKDRRKDRHKDRIRHIVP